MKIALLGYGRMGRAVESVALERGHEIVVRFDVDDDPGSESVRSAMADADVAIDFSVGSAVASHVDLAVDTETALVVGTTDWDPSAARVRSAVMEGGIGFLHGPNFALGVHLFYRVALLAAELAGRLGQHDAHVVETHHRHKRDAPSGTARHLADLLLGKLPEKDRWAPGPADPESPEVLQVTSIRAGEVAGVHLLGLDGPDDRIEVRHEARGRSAFARGAVDAAEWLVGRTGFFTIDDMLADRFDQAEADQ